MKNNFKVLIIGPNMNDPGGICSVINIYNKHYLLENNIIYLASHKQANIFLQLFFFSIFILKYIFHLLINKNVKIIHIHISSKGSFFRKALILFIAKVFNKKAILHIHGSEFDLFYLNAPDFIKKIITNTLNNSDLIIVLSKQWEEKISKISSNPHIKVLYNPTVIKELQNSHSGNVNILFMGRLGKRKGTYDIIEAAKHIESDNVTINMYGDGNVEEFKKLVIDNDLQDTIKINGWISGDEKKEVFKNSNILILPSYNEGLPISILEAMAYGMPVISTPVGGIPEAVENGFNGFLIQPGDYKALAEKIDILANDSKLREKMGLESYKIAKERFDIKVIAKQLEDIYDNLLK